MNLRLLNLKIVNISLKKFFIVVKKTWAICDGGVGASR